MYVFFSISIRNGEYEYTSKSVHIIEQQDITPQQAGDEYAKQFYNDVDSEPEETDEGFYFNGGEVCVWCDRAEEITEEQYNILNKFIP